MDAINYPATTTDALCRDCAHMRTQEDGGRWCHAPQLLKAQGRGSRCIFEVDSFEEPERSAAKGNGKCGRDFANFVRRPA